MHRFRYNFLALSQVSLSAAGVLLLTRTFGVSGAADSFFVAFSIISAAQLLQLMGFEQFMYFYNDIKISAPDSANGFYRFAVTWAAVTGIVSLLAVSLIPGLLVKFFAGGLDPSRFTATLDFLVWFAPYLLFYPAICVNERFLNAEKRFAWPYVISSLPMGMLFLAQVWLLLSSSGNYSLLPAAYSAGAAIGALLGFYVSFQLGARPGIAFTHPAGPALLRNSVAIRLGHNIHGFLLPVVVNNFLSHMPGGAIASYNYAWRLGSALQSVSAGPSQKMLASHISGAVSGARPEEIPAFCRQYRGTALVFFAVLAAAGFFLIPSLLALIGGGMSPESIRIIRDMYVMLLPWFFLMVLEAPYVLTIIAFKRSHALIVVNSAFIAVFVSALFLMRSGLDIYSLPAAGMLAQALNYSIFWLYVRKALKVAA